MPRTPSSKFLVVEPLVVAAEVEEEEEEVLVVVGEGPTTDANNDPLRALLCDPPV